MSDPWAFGWTPLLTIIGFAITIGIATLGFRSFGRWRREKLEEKRIEIALETLAIAHECKYIFGGIRSPLSYPHEWKDLPLWPGETEEQREARGPYAAILFRIDRNKDFLDRLFRLQPRFMAMFGTEREKTFLKCYQARRFIEVSAAALMRDVGRQREWNEERQKRRERYEADIWGSTDDENPELDRVSRLLQEFQTSIINLCEPVAASRRSPTFLPW
jgi:hypothetical protein